VNPGELVVTDAVGPAALALALHRPEAAVLALTGGVAGVSESDLAVAVETRARVVVIAPGAPRNGPPVVGMNVSCVAASVGGALARAIGEALERPGPSIVVIP
jgi:hypothetical protein